MNVDDNQGRESLELIGYVHTQVLRAVGEHPDFPEIAPKEHYALVVGEVRKLFLRAGFPAPQVPSFEHEWEVLKPIQETKPEDYIAQLVKEGQISRLAADILVEVLDILDTVRKPRQKVHAVKELAGYVGQMRSLSAVERNALLTGLKIAESSIEFWQSVLGNRKSPYHAAARKLGNERKRLPWADIIGGVVNCLGCGYVSGVSGCIDCASVSSTLGSSWFGNSTDGQS